ncbi:putative transporter [Aspergillus keveii]|uniref:Transporter n=1 Tax=Aspergillus keveii TaxID=714993 RepID=A0ABR4GN21_9EURO
MPLSGRLGPFIPPRYLTSALIVSIGGLLNGLDTGVIGPLTVMPTFFNTIGPISSIHGFIVSTVLLSATFASLFSGTISDKLGRTRLLAVGSLVFALGATLEASARRLPVFIVGRLVVGTGEGLFLSTLVVYICEISPSKYRDPLASLVQVFITVGLVTDYFMCYGTVRPHSDFFWRFSLALQAGVAALLAILARFWLPESPRWLGHQGRHAAADAAWVVLGIGEADRDNGGEETDTLDSGDRMTIWDRALFDHGRGIAQLRRVLDPGSRRQALLAVFLMSMQQLSGIDGVLYYAPLLFHQAGLSTSTSSFLASGVSAIVICLSSIPAFLRTDKAGRRVPTLYGGIVLATIMALIGSLYASGSVQPDTGVARWVVIVSIYLFAITNCITWALGIKVFASEIQPVPTRATATSIAQSANCITNFAVAYITPILLQKSSSGVYFLFCGCILLTVMVCAVYMPETKGRALESIADNFCRHQPGSYSYIRVL